MSNYIDSIQLSGTVYTIQGSGGGGTVESAITSGSTNAVESKAIYDATHIDSFDLWTATDTNNYGNNTQSLYKVYVQYTGDTALDEQVHVEIYYGSNFTRETITGNVYQETASTSSVFTSTFDNGKWIIESSSPNYIRNIYADYRFKIWVFIRAISDNFAADSIKDDIIPYINDVDTIARNAVTGGNLHQGDSNKELRLLLQKSNGGSVISVMNLDDLKCSNNGTLSTDIQIPTGEIGWTEITPQNNCTAGNMPTNKVKVTYSGQTVSANYRRLQFNAVFATNVNTDYYSVNINWSNTTTPTVNGCSAVTATYDSTDDSVTIELPTGETTYNGSTGTFSIENLRNNYCQFGTGISSVKCYGDITEDIYTAMAHKQNTLSAGTGIEISGNVISATGGGGGTVSSAITSGDTNAVAGGAVYDKFDEVEQVTARALNDLDEKINPTVELTQAEYDALVTAGTVDPNTFYVITDATPVDVSQYWTSAQTQSAITQATSGKVNTSSVVNSVTSASTDSEIPTAKAVWEAASGGGTTYTAGRGIDITNDTVSFDLPISSSTETLLLTDSSNSISDTNSVVVIGASNNVSSNVPGRPTVKSIILGFSNEIFSNSNQEKKREKNYIIGNNNSVRGDKNVVIGANNIGYNSTIFNARSSYIVGDSNSLNCGDAIHKENNYIFGSNNKVYNSNEVSIGYYNNSVSDGTTSGNTFFSVGNGTSNSARHNAFEIRQNGDIYLSLNGQDVKLQDQLGGSSITVDTALDSGSTNPVENRVIYNKIDEIEQVTARALNQLNAKIAEIEEVVARALNQLNDRITALENV